MSCTLRRCQGKNGCICPKKPPSFIYGKGIKEKNETTEKQVSAKAVVKSPLKKSSKKSSPKVIPTSTPLSNVSDAKNNTENQIPKITDQKAIDKTETSQSLNIQHEASSVSSTPITPQNGEVTICYNHYKKKFNILNGSTSSANIDEEYCLSFVFPNCKLHLSLYSPNDYSYEEKGLSSRPMMAEKPEGVYQDLVPDAVYWLHIEEDASENKAYIKRQEAFAQEQAVKRAAQEANENALNGLVVEKKESCSCIEGNPCAESYCCKDWTNRFEVAKRHGWKGFS